MPQVIASWVFLGRSNIIRGLETSFPVEMIENTPVVLTSDRLCESFSIQKTISPGGPCQRRPLVVLHLAVSKNSVTPKSSILIGFSVINHLFWGTTIFGNTYFVEA